MPETRFPDPRKLKVQASIKKLGAFIDLVAHERDAPGAIAFVAEMPTLRQEDVKAWTTPATLTISLDAAHDLMNQLWMCGIRPDFQGDLANQIKGGSNNV